MAEDYYAVLGVDRRASAEEIKRSYRRLTLEFHPDRHGDDPLMHERYRVINQAYNVLSDPTARAKYDAGVRLQQGLDLSRGFDAQSAKDLLGNMFGDVFGARRRERRRGRDLRYTLTVNLEEAVLGSTHDIEFDAPGPCSTCTGTGTRPGGRPPLSCDVCAGKGEVKGEGLFASRTRCGKCDGTGMLHQDPCETCRGRGVARQPRSFTVRVPAGTDSGAEKILEGQGEPGRFGGKPGDLRVTVNVRPHRWLTRKGDEIRCEIPVSLTEASLGARVPVPTVDGVVTVDVPAGIRSGTKLRLRQKGVPGKGRRGDQLVSIVVETPEASDPRAKAALEDLERKLDEIGALPRRREHRSALEDEPQRS